MKLADLQHAYAAYLVSGDSGPLQPAIVEDAFDAGERLAIYRNNFLISLCEALKANFPVTRQLLGDAFFDQAARHFVTAHPPRQPRIAEYGEDFPAYLHALPELAAMTYVAEVARFEFARISAYSAPTEPAISPEALGSLAPEELEALPIRLAYHAQIFSTTAPVLDLWKAHQSSEPDLSAIDVSARQHHLLICRPREMLAIIPLDSTAREFLTATRKPTSLGAAGALCGDDGDKLSQVIAMALELRLLVTP